MPVSKNLELAQLANGLDINQSTGEVVTINLDTDAVSEGPTNLYFTNARADARIALATGANLDLTQVSVGTLSDVDITTVAPTNGQALIWNSTNSEFEPGDSFSQSDFDTAFAAKIATDITFGGNVNLISTDAGTTENPTLELYRNSSNPGVNDVLGHIDFSGMNDGINNSNTPQKVIYAKINADIADETDDTEDGRLDISVIGNGSNSTRMTFQGNGHTLVTGRDLRLQAGIDLHFEGAVQNGARTTVTVVDPTQARTITLPDATGTVMLNVVEDTTPQLGGNLDLNSNNITGTDLISIVDSSNDIFSGKFNLQKTSQAGGTIGWKFDISNPSGTTNNMNIARRATSGNHTSLLNIMNNGHIVPAATNQQDLGESARAWRTIYGHGIDFSTLNSNPSYSEGLLWYSDVNHTLNYYADDSNVVHELGLEEHQRVYNNTGATILKGQPLYFSGNYVTGTIDVPTVGLADATDVNKYNAQGIAASDIATGSYGYCLIAGQLHDVDTSGLSAGANFFVGLTPGAVQNASPVYPNYPMCLGWVVKSDAPTGILLVNQQNHSVNSFRVRTSAHIGSDLQVDGDLTVLGSTTSVSTSDVTAGAPFYRANEGDAIGEAGTTFTGTGLDDAFFSGHFTGTQSTTYYVKIDSVGTPDTFAVSIDNFASTILTNTAITGNKQLIHSADNIYVEFGATTGHTLNDQWTGVAGPVNVDTGFFSNRNTGTSGVGYTHVGIFFDVSDQKWKLVDEYDPTPAGTINTGHASYSEGTLVAGALEGNLDFSYIQNKPDPQITTNLTGTVTGTGSVTLTDLQNGTLNIATTIPGTTNLTLADLIVTNLTVNGTQTINNQTNLTSDDPLFVLNQSQNGEPDIGMIGGYTEASTAQYTGFYRDASDNKWKLFDGYTPSVTSTGSINVNDASFALTTLAAATFEGNLDFSYIQNKPDPVVTVTLTGEVTGTGNTTLTDLTSGTISLATTINPNADVEVNDLVVTGDLNVQGTTTTVNQTTLTVTDSKIFLADGNNADVIDIGTIFEYNDGANNQSAGLFRDANDSGKFKFFSTYTPNVTTTIDTAHSSFALGTVVADTFEGNFTGTLTGNISGSADSAAKLTTSRNLWGQSFNGEANVSGNLTSVGNITGTSAIEIIASGTNQNIVTTPSGTGYTLLGGNVGIGNSVPSEKLSVTGNISADGDVIITGSGVNASACLQINNTDTSNTFPKAIEAYQAGIPVGSRYQIMLGKDGSAYDTATLSYYYAGNASTSNRLEFGFWSAGGLLNIQADGNIGIGVDAPSAKLEIDGGTGQGTSKVIVGGSDALMRLGDLGANSGPHGIQFGYASTSSDGMSIMYRTASDAIVFEDSSGTSGNRVMSVVQTGNVLIGTTTDDGSSKLQVNGNILTSGSVIFEGATDDTNETTLTVTDPTQDRTITLPDVTGTVMVQDSSGVMHGSQADGSLHLTGNNPKIVMTDTDSDASILQFYNDGGGDDQFFIDVDNPNTTADSKLTIKVDLSNIATFDTTGLHLLTGKILRFEGATGNNNDINSN